MRVLVTGAFGFIGTAVVDRLTQDGHEVTALTGRPAGTPTPPTRAAAVRHGDMCDPEAMRAAVADVEGVCHLAASSTSTREGYARGGADFGEVNPDGTGTLVAASVAEAGRRGRPLRFVLASSGAVYGHPSLQPIPEDYPGRPMNVYANTKAWAEHAVRVVPKDGRFGAVTLRLFNAAGAACGGRIGDPRTIIPKTLAVAAGAEPVLRINGDGETVRDFVHVSDIADAFALAFEHAEPDRRATFNVGATGASIAMIVRTVEEVTGRAVPVEHLPAGGEARTLLADTALIRRELGWRPQRSDLSTMIADAWAAYTGARGTGNSAS